MKACAALLCVLLASPALSAQAEELDLSNFPTEKCSSAITTPFSEFKGRVLSVSDGDTIYVSTAQGRKRRIRFLNMDTPETHFQNKSQGEAGDVAYERLSELLPLDSEVTIRFEDKACDGYKRFLGLVFNKAGENVNLQMVREGFAASLCFAPNLASCGEFIAASKENFAGDGPNVFRDYGVDLPHEFRFKVSGKPEAPFIGDLATSKVYPFERWLEIEPLNRVFFTRTEDVVAPWGIAQEAN